MGLAQPAALNCSAAVAPAHRMAMECSMVRVHPTARALLMALLMARAQPSVLARAALVPPSVRAPVARPSVLAQVRQAEPALRAALTDRGLAGRVTPPRLPAARSGRVTPPRLPAARSGQATVRWYLFELGDAPKPATQRRAVQPPRATPIPIWPNTWQA
jgi:hypothetical protein